MKYIKELSSLKLFNKKDVIYICGSVSNANYILKSYIEKGYITKIKKDYYVINDLVNDMPAANKYEIACGYDKNDFISHHSVFEFYGFNNQVYNTIDITTDTFKRDFVFDNNLYKYHKSSNCIQVNNISGIKISTIERAIVDCINDSANFEYYELLECINSINVIDESRVLNYLESLNNKLLYKKVGFVLEKYQDEFNISNDFFFECKKRSENIVGYYNLQAKESLVFNAKWRLFVYKDMGEV
ncbi:MAG: hypothetical protein E7183_01260 [Erysipelotrichaceae bacterium]|nr:hypothetical protein [Erysipelotrichaceae bacterium]